MSLSVGDVLEPAAARHRSGRLTRSAVLSRVPVYFACTLLALITNYLIGKETAWDSLDYHLYLGFSALHDRFGQDFFAAGLQSYFNPYAYVPFYALVRAGLPALAVASLLAIAHSVVLWVTYELGVLVCPTEDRRTQLAYGLCAVALAFLNPILIQQIGSSFADITTGTLALAGWLLLARGLSHPRSRWVLCGGLLLGFAVALKPTNAVHALAVCTMFLLLPRRLADKLRAGTCYAGAVLLGFAMISAPWSYRLEQTFGNPFFPLLNNVFHSPDIPAVTLRHLRFIPSTLGEALWRPFAMIPPGAMVHEELSAPDIRYAVLSVLLVGLAVRWIWRRYLTHHGTAPAGDKRREPRLVTALFLAFAADWTLWIVASGNSRYFLPMSCVAAVLVVAFTFDLFAGHRKMCNYVLAAILGAQALQAWEGSDHRWRDVAWGGPWFDIDVPKRLADEPNLYLSMGVQSNSFIVPYLAPGSGFVNFSGGYALGLQGPAGERLAALMGRYDPHLRMLTTGARVYADSELRAPVRSQIDGSLQRLGLRLDPTDCEAIPVHGVPPDLEIMLKARQPAHDPETPNTTYLVSCRVVRDASGLSEFRARERVANVVFDRLEDACPQIFQPRGMQTEHPGTMWLRNYLATDVIAWVDHGMVEFRDLTRGGGEVEHLGRERDWAQRPQRLVCGRRDGRYYGALEK